MKKKILITILLILLVVLIFITKSYGFGVNELNGGVQIRSTNTLVNVGNTVFTMITSVGAVISVAVLIIIGIKYMVGSVEKKAEYKKNLIPYVVGAALLFGASVISQMIYKLAISL